jgi:hypothetical protein
MLPRNLVCSRATLFRGVLSSQLSRFLTIIFNVILQTNFASQSYALERTGIPAILRLLSGIWVTDYIVGLYV